MLLCRESSHLGHPRRLPLRVAVVVLGAGLLLLPCYSAGAGPALAAQDSPALAKAAVAGKAPPAAERPPDRAPDKTASVGVNRAPEDRPPANKDPARAAAPEPPAAELEPPPRVPAAVFAYDIAGSDPEVAGRLEAAVAAALRPDRRL